jgi:hypothetical protein
LLAPEDESILAVFGDRRVQNFKNSDRLPILNGIELKLTLREVFSWLNL